LGRSWYTYISLFKKVSLDEIGAELEYALIALDTEQPIALGTKY